MAKISKDLSAGTLHPRESQFATGTLGNLGSEVTVAADGAASVSIDVRGTASLVLEVAGSVDGINWTVIPMRPFAWNSSSYFTYFSSAFVGVAAGKCGPFRWVRARVASYTSGSVNVCLLADTAPMDDRFEKITPLMATATGASQRCGFAHFAEPQFRLAPLPDLSEHRPLCRNRADGGDDPADGHHHQPARLARAHRWCGSRSAGNNRQPPGGLCLPDCIDVHFHDDNH
ncbi:MAG: hypothetical protein IPN84_14640 [Sphingomonadales bacterium]|nr:hypothetical protein [Sphingomonadales bacterium]